MANSLRRFNINFGNIIAVTTTKFSDALINKAVLSPAIPELKGDV